MAKKKNEKELLKSLKKSVSNNDNKSVPITFETNDRVTTTKTTDFDPNAVVTTKTTDNLEGFYTPPTTTISPKYEIGYDEGDDEGSKEVTYEVELNDDLREEIRKSRQKNRDDYELLRVIEDNEQLDKQHVNSRQEDIPINKLMENMKKITNAIKENHNDCLLPFKNIKLPSESILKRNKDIIEEYNKYLEDVNKFKQTHHLPKAIVDAFCLDKYPEDNASTEQKDDEKMPTPNEQYFKSITDEMFSTYQKKNKDYGASFDSLFDEFGMTSAILRMQDKLNRLKAITKNNQINVMDESVQDTLKDLANYAILTLIKLHNLSSPNDVTSQK